MPDLPKVLLLGDSIRMSYEPLVRKALEGVAEVVGPEDNCQFALYTLASLDRWLRALGQIDVIHWNNGIHDAGHNPARAPAQIPLVDYRANIEFIVKRLKATGARVIWASTTPVNPRRPWREDQWSWRNEEIDQYNAAARQIMEKYRVPVNDLNAVVKADMDGCLREDHLHLSELGTRRCAEAVVRAIRKELGAPRP
jgi:lysophospholipase L1-like esterase